MTEYQDVFPRNGNDIGKTHLGEHVIDTGVAKRAEQMESNKSYCVYKQNITKYNLRRVFDTGYRSIALTELVTRETISTAYIMVLLLKTTVLGMVNKLSHNLSKLEKGAVQAHKIMAQLKLLCRDMSRGLVMLICRSVRT